MRLFNVKGKLVYLNVKKYLIDWDSASRSKLQTRVKKFLKPFWEKHLCYEEFPVYGSRLKVDFLNATKRIAVEVQGVQHDNFNEFFHKNRLNYFFSIKRDVKKLNWLETNKFKVLEFTEEDVEQLTYDFVLQKFEIYL